MGFRLQRRVRIAPGLNVNISKSGLGLGLGPRGLKASVGPGGTRTSVGIPGTGMRYEKRYPRGSGTGRKPASVKKSSAGGAAAAVPATRVGAVSKAFKRPDERAFINACQCLINGDESGSLSSLYEAIRANPECFDACLIAAMLLCKAGDEATARSYFEKVVFGRGVSYPYINKYLGPDTLSIVVSITDSIKGTIAADTRSAYLLLAEIYQEQGFREHAAALLERAIHLGYDDDLVKVSLLELLNDLERDDEIINLAQGTENADDITLAIIFYWGQAMSRRGYYEAAREVLKKAVSRKKDRDPNLISEARYVLARNYELEGKRAMALKQYQAILSQDFNFRDVRERIDSLTPGPGA